MARLAAAALLIAVGIAGEGSGARAQAAAEAGALGAASSAAGSAAGKASGGALGSAIGRVGAATQAATQGTAAQGSGNKTQGTGGAVQAATPAYSTGGAAVAVWAPADADSPGHGFEVATVKLVDPNVQRQFAGFQAAAMASGRLSVSAMPLESLVFAAYVGGQKTGRVEGGPKWVDTDLWDIEAKLDDADMAGWDKLSDRERWDRVRPPLRALLVERFGLKVHAEMKETAVYVLVQAKGGVKMKEVDAPPANMDPQKWEEWMRDQKVSGESMPGMLMVTNDTWKGHALQASGLAGQIAYAVGATGKPIVDETGLDGRYYDLSFKFTRDKDGPTMEQQIADGLGLRVEERKIPMKTYVIDAAEKPGDN